MLVLSGAFFDFFTSLQARRIYSLYLMGQKRKIFEKESLEGGSAPDPYNTLCHGHSVKLALCSIAYVASVFITPVFTRLMSINQTVLRHPL